MLIAASTVMVGPAAATHGKWLLGGGQQEPNTSYDTAAYMWQSPNQEAVDKAYLNGLIISGPSVLTASYFEMNLDGGNVAAPGGLYALALLGFWRDCNKDGYVGFKGATPTTYGSMGTYLPEASAAAGHPVDETICPKGASAYWPKNEATGSANGLVDEFRSIGSCWTTSETVPKNTDPVCLGQPAPRGANICVPLSCPSALVKLEGQRPTTHDINDVRDNASRVWGDWERPGAAHVPYQGLIPTPRGTMQDSDGTLTFVDDATLGQLSALAPGAWRDKPNVGKCDQPHPVFLGGPGGTCGLWPLYQVSRLGNDTTCSSDPRCNEPDPLVSVFDNDVDDNGDGNPCNDAFSQSFDVPSPTGGGTKYWIALPDLKPSANPTSLLADGSIAGQFEHLNRGTNGTLSTGKEPAKCDDSPAGTPFGLENCAVYECESESNPSATRHVESTFFMNYTWSDAQRNFAQFGFDGLTVSPGTYSPGTPRSAASSPEGMWSSGKVWSPRPPRSGWGALTTAYASFYADITPQAFAEAGTTAGASLPAGRQDAYVYGSESCPTIFTGPSHVTEQRWECSRTEWQAFRAAKPRIEQFQAILGDAYDLRDVDCFDNTVKEDVSRDVKLSVAANCADVHP